MIASEHETAIHQHTGQRLIRLPEVMARVGFGRSWVYARVAEGTFPRPVSLGEKAVAWVESEIDAWICERIAARKAA